MMRSSIRRLNARASKVVARLKPWQWEALAAVFRVTGLMNGYKFAQFGNALYALAFAVWCAGQAEHER
jgi:hypothetical protein